MFEGFTDFIMKDDKRGTDIEVDYRERDKDGKMKGGKKDGKKIK